MRRLTTFAGMPTQDGRFLVLILKNGIFHDQLKDHSGIVDFGSSGFSWGGLDEPGGNQLSVALLSEVIGPDKAIQLHEPFRRALIDHIPPYEPFRFCANTIAAIAQSCERRFVKSRRHLGRPGPAAGLPVQHRPMS